MKTNYYLSVSPSVYLSVLLSICLFIHLFVCISGWLFVCLSYIRMFLLLFLLRLLRSSHSRVVCRVSCFVFVLLFTSVRRVWGSGWRELRVCTCVRACVCVCVCVCMLKVLPTVPSLFKKQELASHATHETTGTVVPLQLTRTLSLQALYANRWRRQTVLDRLVIESFWLSH